MAVTHIAPQFFPGNIVNTIHKSPLIKMVPLLESSGGCTRTNSGPWATCVNYKIRMWMTIKFDKTERRPFWISHDPHFRSFQNPFQSIQHPKKLILDILLIQIGQLVQKLLTYRFFRMASGGHFENRFPELLPWSSMSTQVYFTPGVVP